MNNQSSIECVVMRRVHLIRILKLVISTAVFAVLTFVVSLWGIGKKVWVARIFENMPTVVSDLPAFYFQAFLHTHIVVQALTILTLIAFIYLVVEITRLLIDIVSGY